MPYADRKTQLQYLKDRRVKLKKGRPINQKPYSEMQLGTVTELAKPFKIVVNQKPKPYIRKESLEKEKVIKEPNDQQPLYIFM